MKIIDFHTHLGKLIVNTTGNTPEMLIEQMDKNGIEQSVVMAVENPEEVDYYFTSYQVLEACQKYPDRLIPFCSIDPRRRYPGKFECKDILMEYVKLGFKGFGEILAGVPFDYPDLQKIYAACGELGLPIVFHTDYHILFDEPGQPRLEKMLQEYPDTIFVGHSIHFWAEISADCQPEDYAYTVYAKGPVIPGGATDRLLSQYPNLYGDLSANSGYNALTRDPEFGIDFLIRQQDKLVFGTDILKPGQSIPILELLLNAPITDEVRAKIMYKNAEKLLKMDGAYVR